MPSYFLDTSALAKAYRAEAGTDKVEKILAEPGSRIFISSLTCVEFQSVFAQKVRAGEATLADFELLRKKFGDDLKSKRIVVKTLYRRHQQAAEKLIAAHGPFRRLRTLDALQLAMAIELNGTGTTDHFVVADVHLAAVASLEGISVINPEIP